jgi:signal recognition particle subunit SRP54
MKKIEAIIFSMTPLERKHYKVLNSSRKKRIAKGSGTKVSDVNRLLNQLQQMNKMMKQFKKKMGGKNKVDKKLLNKIFPMH